MGPGGTAPLSPRGHVRTMLASLLRILAGLLVAYAALLVLAWWLQDRMAFPGRRQRLIDPRDAGLSGGEIVSITTSDGVRLRGWYLPPAPEPLRGQRAPGLLWFYGNMETVSALAPIVRDLRPPDIALLMLDYRGYGESGGSPSEAGIYRDAEAAWEYLAARPDVDASRIAVYGRSVGSAVATHLADTKPVRAVVLDSPFSNAKDMARIHYAMIPRALVRLSLDNLGRVGRLNVPLLVFHGTDDDIVPPRMGRAVAEAGRARELVLISGAGHNDTYDVGGREYREKLHAFLREMLF